MVDLFCGGALRGSFLQAGNRKASSSVSRFGPCKSAVDLSGVTFPDKLLSSSRSERPALPHPPRRPAENKFSREGFCGFPWVFIFQENVAGLNPRLLPKGPVVMC